MEKISIQNQNNNNFHILKKKYVKYPFCGVASNLIDKFLVIGYEQRAIEYALQKNKRKNINNFKNNPLQYIEFNSRPVIMNEICCLYSKISQDNDKVLEYIFPNYPKMFLIDKKDIKENSDVNEEINDYSVIFSLNPVNDDSSKNSFNGLGYVFYIKKEHRNKNNEIDLILYYPISYVILSDYPYYYHFNKICKNVFLQMKKVSDEIPIDIILYNAIKHCPSPININLNLSFGAQLANKDKDKKSLDKILNQLYQNSKKEINSGIPYIFFSQLSGYPFIDINLSFIFNLLEPQLIIKIFIFTFLEYDLVFVSSHPGILNIIMYIFANLNYPFNDSIYYWHIFSLSQKEFMLGSFMSSRTYTAITGICCEYSDDIETSKKISEHFLVDIDNKNCLLITNPKKVDKDMIENIMTLNYYIESCIPDVEENKAKNDEKINNEGNNKNNFNDGINLYEAITNLGIALNRRFRSVTNVNYNESNYKPSFFIHYDNESEIDMMKENIQIQRAFYNFIVQIMATFYNEKIVENVEIEVKQENREEEKNEIKGEKEEKKEKILSITINQENKGNKKSEEQQELTNAQIAGLTFRKLFNLCSKKTSFLENFCKNHDCIDISKIPYSFFNELFYFSKIGENNCLDGIDIFKIIDQFYGKLKKIDFCEIIKEKQEEAKLEKPNLLASLDINKKNQNINNLKNISNFSYDEFEEFYKNNLRVYINREQEDDKINFIKEQGTSKHFRSYKRNNFFLSQKILEKYAIFCNNNDEQLKNIFKLSDYKDFKAKENLHTQKIIPNINQKEENNFNGFYIIEEKKIEKNNINNNELKNKEDNKENEVNELKKKDKFDTYELVEISDLIEKHLILEKYFSCYEMLKFSLFNIIAISIGWKNRKINNVVVIKIICDFCNITKSFVRKYMNIYLNIFATMKINNLLSEQECNDCTNIIISYFKRTNTFPTEDTVNPIKKAKTLTSIDNIMIDYKSLNDFKSENKNLREKRAEFYHKIDEKKEAELIDYIEKVFYGWYYSNKNKNKLISNIKDFATKFNKLYSVLLNKKSKKLDFVPKTPLELYSITNKFLFEYLNNFDNNTDNYLELGTLILSLLYYFKMEFFLDKWSLDKLNYKMVDSIKEVVKSLVINIIFILLDLYEAIIHNKNIKEKK